MTPHPDPDREAKQSIVLILCFMLVIASVALGWYVTILWTILSRPSPHTLYVWTFHIHWRSRR